MRRILLTILLLLPLAVVAQSKEVTDEDPRPKNNLGLTLLGDYSIISAYYERLSFLSPKFVLVFKFGGGYNQGWEYGEGYMSLPHHVSANLGNERHFFEFGVGGTLLFGEDVQTYQAYPLLGYRLHPLRYKKMHLRVFAAIPFSGLDIIGFGTGEVDVLFAPFGLSLGISVGD